MENPVIMSDNVVIKAGRPRVPIEQRKQKEKICVQKYHKKYYGKTVVFNKLNKLLDYIDDVKIYFSEDELKLINEKVNIFIQKIQNIE